MKQGNSYIVETYDKQTNTIVHTMVVENGEYIQSDYEDQMALLNSEPGRYKRNIIPLQPDDIKYNSAPERSKNNE